MVSATREAKRPSDFGEPGDDLVVEYDEEVLRSLKERDDFVMSAEKRKSRQRFAPLTKARLAEMIEQATVDAYGESEQVTGWFTMIEENLAVPFETMVLGVPVTVERVDLNRGEQIVAICRRGRARQLLSILDLPLPTPPPDGAEWIEAYRRWRAENHLPGMRSERVPVLRISGHRSAAEQERNG